MKRASLVIVITLLICAAAFGQAPGAPAGPPQTPRPEIVPGSTAPKPPAGGTGMTGPVAVIDFMKAVTGNAEGTRASNRLQAEFNKRQTQLAAKQKEGQDAQTMLTSQDKVLSEVRKAELAKTIDRVQTDLTRMNDDYQKEMQDLQGQFLAPVANVVRSVMEKYAAEKGYVVVFDVSGDANNIVYKDNSSDITDEVIARVDEETAKIPAKPAPGAPPAPRPATTPTTPAAPKPATPPSTTPKPPDATKKP